MKREQCVTLTSWFAFESMLGCSEQKNCQLYYSVSTSHLEHSTDTLRKLCKHPLNQAHPMSPRLKAHRAVLRLGEPLMTLLPFSPKPEEEHIPRWSSLC